MPIRPSTLDHGCATLLASISQAYVSILGCLSADCKPALAELACCSCLNQDGAVRSAPRADVSDGDAPAPAVPDAREIITMRKREPQGASPLLRALQCHAIDQCLLFQCSKPVSEHQACSSASCAVIRDFLSAGHNGK